MCRFLGLRTRLGEREQARMCQAFLGSTLIKLDPIVRVGSAAIRGGDREARVVGTALNPQNARFQSLALV